ncbi:hypothetical protein NUW58_g9382 [Xylaria curta]|uniref:Uncharacterized protein n=1 Tax=Xylaria curta TaxID=42375 RepID=A0ACC1MXJ3_9PEZI|nr:hypothetical protein NUW58_g9382 [Xylaria curta]
MPDISSLQIATPGVGILAVFLSFILYYVVHVVYLLFFHPLAKFPGPKLAAISDLWWVLRLSSGRLPFITEELHKKHGDVVRIGPNELSFASAQAFQEIHGHISKGKARFLKTEFYENDDPTPRITSARDPELHSRQRKALSHAFSAQALRHQEDIIQKYVDGFIQQIARSGENGKTALNMSDTFNWLTFDVIGDLAFGEPFGSVEQGRAHPWINIILDGVLNAQIIFMRRRRPLYNLILPFILPKGISQNHKTHRRLGVEKGRRRLAMGDRERDDFFSHMLKKKTLSEKEMISQSPTLIIAGSETTATSLTGTTWFLLKNPECMAKIQKEQACRTCTA